MGIDQFRLVAATEADLPFVMATERTEGYAGLVGRWEEARHLDALADGRHAYYLGELNGAPIGFGIVRDARSPERVALLKRIAVSAPGQGRGRALVRALTAEVFRNTETYRLWLGVYPHNVRARRAYEAAGFVAEGIARGSAFFDGQHRDELIMAILRPDWSGGTG